MNIIYQEHSTPYYSIESINNSFPAHLHKELELTLVLSGEIDITIEEKVYHLQKGDMIVITGGFPKCGEHLTNLMKIEMKGINKAFGSNQVLKDAGFVLEDGEV